jgi:hypothetical protein
MFLVVLGVLSALVVKKTLAFITLLAKIRLPGMIMSNRIIY